MAAFLWTTERTRLLVHLRDEQKLSWARIGMAIGLTADRARVKYNEVKGLAFEDKKRGARPSDDIRITQAVRPQAITLAQAILGDPPPGRSALDRKRREP